MRVKSKTLSANSSMISKAEVPLLRRLSTLKRHCPMCGKRTEGDNGEGFMEIWVVELIAKRRHDEKFSSGGEVPRQDVWKE